MRRSERESTIKHSQLVQKTIALREENKQRRKANKSSTSHQIIDLSSETGDNNTEVDTSDKDSSGGEVFGSGTEEEYWIDPNGQELSGFSFESPVSPFPPPATDPETWSISVNRHPLDSNLLDTLRNPNLQLGVTEDQPSSSLELSQPKLSSSSSSNTSVETVTRKNMAMDNEEFYRQSTALENLSFAVDSHITRFNKDTVDLLDLATYEDKLQKIYAKFEDFEKAYLEVKNKLDRRIEGNLPKLEEIKKLHQDTQKRVVDNEVAVKRKLRELQAADTTTPVPVLTPTASIDGRAKEKIELKIKHATKKFEDLTKVISDLGEVDSMSEHVVREKLVDSKDWKKDLKTYRDLKEAIDLEAISIDIDAAVQTELNQVYEKMVTLVNEMISKLSKADKDLGLFALSDGKVKSSIQYPDAFSGALGENVYKFVKEFNDAIQSDQIRKADEVKTLMKYLKGSAKSTIGEHHISLKSALDQLEDNYGSPRLIVDKYLRDFDKSYGNVRHWGKHGSKERVEAINKTLDFLRNLESLCNDHPDHLRSEIYSCSTLTLITKGMPYDYTKKLNERCTHKDTYESWFTVLFDILEENKSTNLSALSTGIGAVRSNQRDVHSDGVSNKSNQLKHNGHDCSKSNTCKDKWDLLGCINLYKLKSVEERETFLRGRRACFRCDKSPFLLKNQGKHICNWKGGKMDARCLGKVSTGARCWKGATMCLDHADSASDVLKDWLNAQRIKFTVSVVVANVTTTPIDSDDEYYEQLRSEMFTESNVNKVNVKAKDRGSLQSGESAQQMNDDEIFEFFSSDMRRIKSKSKVHRIPEGEAVFILTVVKGRLNPVMCFMDNGANCWIAQEGIPEQEFISVKLNHGPIPLSVAGGNTAYASGEYASLLPLVDGSFQCVRGLTLQQVTGSMPELNLVPVFENLKASAEVSDNDRIQNLSIPKKLGGNIQMLLGIKYQNIFPKVLHTFPNGLTIFESKLMPASSGALACIGGPISCIDHICDTIGASSTLSYMANLTQNLGNYTKLEFFPSNELICDDLRTDTMSCEDCGAFSIQSEMERFLRMQDAGLDTNYKCPKCRQCKDCKKGSGHELLSMKEEFEQQVIEESVTIDSQLGQAIAFLAFTSDPVETLGENEHIAIKRLQNVCRKYSGLPEVKSMIIKGFQKLIDKGHIIMFDQLDEHEQHTIESGPSYTIPWDVGFKQESLTTPARPTFDASSKTQDGLSLNDNLAKGKANLINMVNMCLNWLIGPVAITGDISQFYNCVLLRKDHWRYQRVVWYEDLDPNNKLLKGIIQTLIYGVKCVSAQTEHVKRLLEEQIREKEQQVKKMSE